MCAPVCPRLIHRRAPAAPEDEAVAVAAPAAEDEAAADVLIPAAAEDSSMVFPGELQICFAVVRKGRVKL